MGTRRGFLAGVLAAGSLPRFGWAAAGNPAFLSAAQLPNGDHVLSGLNRAGDILFDIPLPARGHAGTRHPERAEAVFFARRPGTFARVIDCVSGGLVKDLTSPIGSHFSGHGAFSADGETLFTTENDYEAARGMIGVWDARRDYRRVGAFASGGVGPHEMLLAADGGTLVVANGGIETHPDSGRAKLNIPFMRPNLSYLTQTGEILNQVEPVRKLHRNSIRHIAALPDGTIAIGCQWEGTSGAPPVVALHQQGAPLQFVESVAPLSAEFEGYVGSVAASTRGRRVAASSPRGGLLVCFDAETGAQAVLRSADVCGLAGVDDGFVVSSGTGAVLEVTGDALRPLAHHRRRWDNHLVPVTA